MTRELCVVLADVVGSREIEDRSEFKERLSAVIRRVNEEYESDIHTDFSILKGVDEIGGVLNSVHPIIDIQRDFSMELHPERIRIAAVIGQVDIHENSSHVSQLDGMAFARADSSLAELEDRGYTFRLSGKREDIDEMISDQVNLIDMIRSNWSERTIEIALRRKRFNTQKQVAEDLDITPQAVSYHLTKNEVEMVLDIDERLSNTVQSYEQIR